MKKIMLIVLAALMIACCTIFTLIAAANEPDAVPPAKDALALGLITEDLDAEAVQKTILATNITIAEERFQTTIEAIINEPLTYVPAASYDIKSLEKVPLANTIHVGNDEMNMVIDTYQMDEETLKSISTEELWEYAFNITLFDIMVGSSDNWLDSLYSNRLYTSNIYAELESRSDAAYYLLKKYLTSPVDGDYMRTRNIEIFLTRKACFEKLTDEELQIFVVKYAQNALEREEKNVSFAFINTLETVDEYVAERYNDACAEVGIRPFTTKDLDVGFAYES